MLRHLLHLFNTLDRLWYSQGVSQERLITEAEELKSVGRDSPLCGRQALGANGRRAPECQPSGQRP